MALDGDMPVPQPEAADASADDFLVSNTEAVRAGFPNLPVSTAGIGGLDAATLRAWASSHSPRLVVCSRAVFERLLSLRDRLPFPLLSVPGEAVFLPVRAIAAGLMPGDTNEEAARLTPLFSLAQALGAKVDLMEVETTDARSNDSSAGAPQVAGVQVQHHRIAYHAVDDGLLHFVQKMGNQWLALLPHHRSWVAGLLHASITGALAKAATLPLLILPGAAGGDDKKG